MPNRTDYKIILLGQEARDKIKNGMSQVANLVRCTLGGISRSVMFEYKGRTQVANDGMRIAQEVVLKDEVENLGAQAIIEVAIRQNEMAGDGTTTAMILTEAIIDEAMKKIGGVPDFMMTGGVNVLEIRRQIQKSCKNIIEKLKQSANPIATKEELEKVAAVSLDDEELGKIVAGMVWEVGKDGCVTVEEGFHPQTEYEVIKGMKFPGTYISDFLITNAQRKEAVWENTSIIVTNATIESFNDLKAIYWAVQEKMKKDKVAVIAWKFDKAMIPPIIMGNLKTPFKLLAIKASEAHLEDVAAYTGAVFLDTRIISPDKSVFENFTPDMVGRAEKVIASKDDIYIMGGGAKREDIKKITDNLKVQLLMEKTEMFRKKLEKRIASLSSGIGLIQVGAMTEQEREYLRLKIDDAVCASKVALEEGVVKGGGLALKEIAEKLPDDDILKEPIMAPWRQIQKNAGGTLEISENIIDPLKVVRLALENACSEAGIFITTDGVIVWQRPDIENTLKKALGIKND